MVACSSSGGAGDTAGDAKSNHPLPNMASNCRSVLTNHSSALQRCFFAGRGLLAADVAALDQALKANSFQVVFASSSFSSSPSSKAMCTSVRMSFITLCVGGGLERRTMRPGQPNNGQDQAPLCGESWGQPNHFGAKIRAEMPDHFGAKIRADAHWEMRRYANY